MSEEIKVKLSDKAAVSLQPTDTPDLACMAVATIIGGLAYVGLKRVVSSGREGRAYA